MSLATARQPGPAPVIPAFARLSGRNVGLLCEDPARPDALSVCRAAIELGAHVSLVRPQLDGADAGKAADTARMLGRLYDALACVALAPQLVEQLRERAEVPVLDDASVLSLQGRPQPQPEGSADRTTMDDNKIAWQAALIGSLG
jgi:ornithine carbamoyltransferase